jgi:low affinity Fe/Cu permease
MDGLQREDGWCRSGHGPPPGTRETGMVLIGRGLPRVRIVIRQSKPSLFQHFANYTARGAGHPATFASAVMIILIWAVMGPVFHYSDTWQLVINTGTTIVTFLMVFLIQNSQNRESKAVQIKLDEIIRALEGAHNRFLNLEDMDEKELDAIHKRYVALAEHARAAVERGEEDTAALELLEDNIEQAEEAKAGVSARKKARAERNRRGGKTAA